MLKELYVNILLVEVPEQIPGYVKFLQALVNRKQTVRYEYADNVYHNSVVAFKLLLEKKAYSGAFTFQFTIRSFNFSQDLYDLRASIKHMSLVMFK